MNSPPNNQLHSESKKENSNSNGNSTSSKNMKGHDLNKSKNEDSFVQERRDETVLSLTTNLRSKRSSNLVSFVINLSSFVVLVILFLLFKKNFITPFKRGFFCNDLTIRYPVREDTISTSALVGFSILIAILVFILGEYIFDVQECPRIKNLKHLTSNINFIYNYLSPKRWYIRVLKFFFIYSWGLLASQVLVNVLKCSVGSLRPNFFIVCNPNVTCNNGETTKYHTDYGCQEEISPKEEANLRTSFPSGHAAFSAAAALFLVVYTQSKMKRCINISCCGSLSTISTFVVLMRPSLQFVCLVLSCWASLVRVSDYKHHLTDVLIGYVLGSIIGVMSACHALGWDSTDGYGNCSKKDEKTGSGISIQELVELNEERCQQKPECNKDEDIEKVMEHEGMSNPANVNVLTVVKTESE